MINISKDEIGDKMFFVREEDSNQPIAVVKVGDLMKFERPQGDLKSSEALKAYAREVLCGNNPTNSLLIRMFDEIIDNAPTVESERQQSKVVPNIKGCFNCKHEDKRLIEKPCKYCYGTYRKWEAKEE